MKSFTKTARILHWLMAPLIIAMLCIGVLMVASLSLRPALLTLHRPLGLAIFLLAALRLAYRWKHPPPPLPNDLPRWQTRAARASHGLLYALMLALPLIGWAMLSAGGYPVPLAFGLTLPPILPPHPALYALLHLAHVTLAWSLSALILLHLAGALHHALIRKDGVFSAMIGAKSKPKPLI